MPAFVDQSNIEVMTRLNQELTERLDDEALRKRFEGNVHLIRELMLEITSRVRESLTDIDTSISQEPASEQRLAPVFDMLNI